MKKRKILFITPPYHCGVVEVAGRWIPLQFVYLAGAAREAGFEAKLYDAMSAFTGFKEIKEKIKEEKPDLVGVSAITSTFLDCLEILKISKSVDKKIITVMGGVHPTFMKDEAFNIGREYLDFLIRGEGEITLKELLLCLSDGGELEKIKGLSWKNGGEVIHNPPRELAPDIDSFKTDWSILDWNLYRYFVIPRSRLGAVSTSRGCSMECTFCSQQKFWKRTWRFRDPEKVAEEIEMLNKDLKVNVFLITDEYPTSDRERWISLLKKIIMRNIRAYFLMETRVDDIVRDRDVMDIYRSAGIIHIYVGVESASDEVLSSVKKKIKVEQSKEALEILREKGFISETSFVLGFPWETEESIKRTIDLSIFYNPDMAHFLAITPWPYADLYKELEKYIEVKDYRKYNLIEPVARSEKLGIDDINRGIIEGYRRFYAHKLKEVLRWEKGLKKDYMMRSMKLIMKSSFIREKIKGMGKMPEEIRKIMSISSHRKCIQLNR